MTFRPFAALPPAVQQAYLGGKLRLVPHPAGLIFFEHAGYRRLAAALPARRTDSAPASVPAPRRQQPDPDPAVGLARRARRRARVARPARPQGREAGRPHAPLAADGARSERPRGRHLRGPGLGRAVLDRPRRSRSLRQADGAQRADLERGLHADPRRAARDAARAPARRRDGRPAVAGSATASTTRPCARASGRSSGTCRSWRGCGPAPARPRSGAVGTSPATRGPRRPPNTPTARRSRSRRASSRRPGYLEAATLFGAEPGHARFTTMHNIHKLLEFSELLDGPLPPSFARALTHAAKRESFDAWLEELRATGQRRRGGRPLRRAPSARRGRRGARHARADVRDDADTRLGGEGLEVDRRRSPRASSG